MKGVPTIVVENGRVLSGRLRRARLTEDNVLEAARRLHGLETMDEIKFAIFEASMRILDYSATKGRYPRRAIARDLSVQFQHSHLFAAGSLQM